MGNITEIHLDAPTGVFGVRVRYSLYLDTGPHLRYVPESSLSNPSATCLDCGLPYDQFPLDVLLPRSQWLEIHPAEHGLLCARCIVARAARLPGILAVHMFLEIAVKR